MPNPIYELVVQPELGALVYRLKIQPNDRQCRRIVALIQRECNIRSVNYHAHDNEFRIIDPPPLTPGQLRDIGRKITNVLVPAYRRSYKA